MKKNEVQALYDAARERLVQKGVRVPRLRNTDGTYAVTGLSFVFFFHNLRKIMKKLELLRFLRAHGCCKDTMPHPRHFGMQYGMYFLVDGCYHPIKRRVLSPGEYCLYSVARGHPDNSDAVRRRKALGSVEFARLKSKFGSRCGVCGSCEHDKNLKNSALVTKLEMGHCDPSKPLASGNCIPMCQYCNHVYKDKYVFNKRGIIVGTTDRVV